MINHWIPSLAANTEHLTVYFDSVQVLMEEAAAAAEAEQAKEEEQTENEEGIGVVGG